ncbi:NAD(P)-dependent malic enzyme [Veillonella criceti]|uniref:NADP-dependent malic enzyme n=1 Tax=Veillonella criceti TaxID=103891 RepID=A0A380NMD4_9FIRM|nr:NADP-dependent malic enzyme [Veillonella criceti]SUP44421.1 NADP-dependent malic enzyme [Veillonella criceti]
MDVREEAVQKKLELGGFLTTGTKYPLKDAHDLSVAYTPGVAEPCLRIKEKEELSFDLTCRGNMVAVVSDGTRVLGLGDIGAAAAMPVMEGKSLLFKRFGNVDCVPIVVDTKDADELIHTVKLLQKNFAGINLEDISSPKCYEIENRLKEELEIPVFHDDQHGTAIACLAGVKAALRFVKKDLSKVKIVVNGAGAAGANIARLLYLAGARDITLMVSSGVLNKNYKRLDSLQAELIKLLGQEEKTGTLAEVAKGADVLLGVSAAGAFTEEILKNLAEDSIVFAMANPNPEAMYDDAKACGVRVMGTGRSDAPNQINNVNVFPGLFRGAIDVHASKINDEMKLAAAEALANLVADEDLREDYVVANAFDERVPLAVAKAVAEEAVKTGVARKEIK